LHQLLCADKTFLKNVESIGWTKGIDIIFLALLSICDTFLLLSHMKKVDVIYWNKNCGHPKKRSHFVLLQGCPKCGPRL